MVADNLRKLLQELPSGVKLVAVSKFHPVERLMEAYDAGQRIFGENRPQELALKVPQMPSDVEWHFIGHLQTNKLKLVLPFASLVQSVDSLHLLEAIDRWGSDHDKVIDILLELHLGSEETKHGFSEEEILDILSGGTVPSENCATLGTATPKIDRFSGAPGTALRGARWPGTGQWEGRRSRSDRRFSEGIVPPYQNIRIRGIMGMATNTEDQEVIRKEFSRIQALFGLIREKCPHLTDTFTELSIGMSDDWPLAVEHGSTMVRIGTAIFGPREY